MALSCLAHVKRNCSAKRPIVPTITNVKLVVDRSGSMIYCIKGAKIGMRTFLEQQQKMAEQGAEIYLEVVTFDDIKEVPFHGNAKDLDDEAIQMCVDALKPRGTTRLNDTLGETMEQQIYEIADMQKSLSKTQQQLGVNVSGACAIITDGEDNASDKYTIEDVRKLVEYQEENGVLCQFIGANIDAISTGLSYGYNKNHTLQMGTTAENTKHAIFAVTSSQERQHSGGVCAFTPMERQVSNSGGGYYNTNTFSDEDYDDNQLTLSPQSPLSNDDDDDYSTSLTIPLPPGLVRLITE